MKRFKKGTANRIAVDAITDVAKELAEDLTYTAVKKSGDELRYTFGPLYSPNVTDAHGEYALGDDLQKAVFEYVRAGDFRLRKQHDPDVVIGEIVEIVQWPFDLDTELVVAGVKKHFHLPAGTVYNGVVWSEDAWPLVKSGEITGLSMGGTAVRITDPG